MTTRLVALSFTAFFVSLLAWLPSCGLGGQTPNASEPGLLVVAPKAFHDALADFVAFKAKRLATKLVELEDVLTKETGADDPEKLKRFLYAGWKEKRFAYVLLVGDVDVFPTRYMVLDRVTKEAFDYAFYPSDLYYADVAKEDGSFDDWNGNKDGFHAGYYGETRGEKNKNDPINFDQISYVPELAVGRWPVSTAKEVEIVAKKTMRHEEAVADGKKPGAKRVGFFAVGGWVDSRGLMSGLADGLGKRFEVSRYFYGKEGPQPTEPELYGFLKDGAALVVHAGHGDAHCWEKCCSLKGLAKVKNGDRLPVLFSCGCGTAYFAPLPPYEAYTDVDGKDHKGTNAGEVFTEPPPPAHPYQKKHNPTGLGEQALKAGPDGAVAYIGCNTGSQPCGLSLAEGFCQHLAAHEQPRLGDCWKAALAHYWKREKLATLKPNKDWYPPSIFFQGMKFMLFGDPTIPLP